MNPPSPPPAAITRAPDGGLALSGAWTGAGLGTIQAQLEGLPLPAAGLVVEAAGIEALDTAGAWVLQKFLGRLAGSGGVQPPRGLRPAFAKLLEVVGQPVAQAAPVVETAPVSRLESLGRQVVGRLRLALLMLGFIGEVAWTFGGCLRHPSRLRWRPVLFNIRSAGFDALPIVGLLSFLMGIVIVYQGAAQLRLYGANIFVVDLVGLSMLREFAPLMTAIIIAGRSGSAYAAQIGSMAVSEEIDAMRTLGMAPLEVLVLPKFMALLVALPLLTVFADVLGVVGGMLMARAELGVGYGEFLDRFAISVSATAYLVGLGKAPVFATIIAVVGCFQGFQTRGGADSVGRHTTRSVVQGIFLVIVVDALFSIAFSMLDL